MAHREGGSTAWPTGATQGSSLPSTPPPLHRLGACPTPHPLPPHTLDSLVSHSMNYLGILLHLELPRNSLASRHSVSVCLAERKRLA